MADKNTLSPIMQQYLEMKRENPGAILLFRLGDFYEAFFGDAVDLSRSLGLVLTHRGTDDRGVDIPMCGVPWHAADNYMGRLVKAGRSVAICEQMETPEEAKARGHKQIERKIVRVLTPGTLTDDNLLTPKKSNWLAAVSGSEIAACDISTGELIVGKAKDVFDELVRLNPAEVIYAEESAELVIIKKIRENFNTTPVYSKTVRIKDGNSAAENILYSYLENTQRGTKINFGTPKVLGAGESLLIDSATWKSLEIDAPILAGGSSLLDVIDKTKTAAGARKLQALLRELSADISEIKQRQEHIGHLILNKDVANNLSAELSKLPDIGRALSRLGTGRGAPRDLRAAFEFLNSLPALKVCGSRLDKNLADKFTNLKTFDGLNDELSRALSENLPTFFRDGGIIRAGFDSALDNMNNLAHGAKEVVANMQAEYILATDVNTLKIKYNNILGYHIEVPAARADKLFASPDNFIHRQTMVQNVRFTTSRLIELDNEIRGASEKANGIEQEIIAKLIAKIIVISDDLIMAADLIAECDVWLSLALAAQEYNWVRPEIVAESKFEISGGRHPVVESIMRSHGDTFIKNDCKLIHGGKVIALLTGPNMAGKSTYLRQNALIVVLAHLGSFVPATRATIGICDQLFSRVGASDNLAAGQSTFMVEMQETANILNRATSKSFIIFDEVGRGTATYDGMAIANAILEFLNTLQPRTLFATHYHELTKLTTEDSHLVNLTMEIREHNNEVIFMHKVVPGVANRSYGIHVAKMAGMPVSVVESAEKILNNLEGNGKVAEPKSKTQMSLF